MGTLLHAPVLRWGFLGMVFFLLLGSMSLVYIKFVKVKMLPFDNKSEFQVIVDMPNGTTLEQTARVTQALAVETQQQPEVITYRPTSAPPPRTISTVWYDITISAAVPTPPTSRSISCARA